MHIHILGICGTFMGSLAVLAKELGHHVTGSDANVYPPMSTQLQAQGIELTQGYDPAQLDPAPDVVVIGNALSRGNPAVEYVLNKGLPYVSGPQWLADHVLQGRWVLAVAGTHGKTTTSSMLAWVLEHAGMAPGFLIGGVPQNFAVSARLGDTPFFVVEADEYDSAFFDKRSKFVHYRPRTAILNNLEFDHADIFPDLPAIERQFHHLVRTIPSEGLVIHPTTEPALQRVIEMGCWTPVQTTGEGGQWQARLLSDDGSRFDVLFEGNVQGTVEWDMTGQHNVANALATLAAARHVGVVPSLAIAGLYSILCKDATPSTSLAASWSEALIEAYAWLKTTGYPNARVLVVYYDEALPAIYKEFQPFNGFAMSAVISLEAPNLQLDIKALTYHRHKYLDAQNFYDFWQQSEQSLEHSQTQAWQKC